MSHAAGDQQRRVHAPNVTSREGAAVTGTHEWVSFHEPERSRTWVFDLTFLESNWTCIYGRGCKGVLREPATDSADGCCSYGARFNCKEDVDRVEAASRQLTNEQWQYKSKAAELGGAIKTPSGNELYTTRLVDDGCVFLNRAGFAGGAGCALHIGALSRGQHPLDWKPDTCWQLPFRVDQTNSAEGHLTLSMRQWERGDWGKAGYEFHWWCTEPEAYVGTRPVYEELRSELVAMIGPATHEKLERHLLDRRALAPVPNGVPVSFLETRSVEVVPVVPVAAEAPPPSGVELVPVAAEAIPPSAVEAVSVVTGDAPVENGRAADELRIVAAEVRAASAEMRAAAAEIRLSMSELGAVVVPRDSGIELEGRNRRRRWRRP